jgi:hypothetical protein
VAREREKKGRHDSDWMTPFLQGGMAERELGGGGPVVVARERWSQVTAGRCCSAEQGSGSRRHVVPHP